MAAQKVFEAQETLPHACRRKQHDAIYPSPAHRRKGTAPKCLEGKFCELLCVDGVPRSTPPPGTCQTAVRHTCHLSDPLQCVDVIEKGKPAARRGRKAYGPLKEVAGLPNQPEQDQRRDQQEWEPRDPSGAGEHEAHTLVFIPRNPTPLRRMIVRAIAGPLLWLIALGIVLITLNRTQAIELGVLIAAASFALSTIVLLVLRALRLRQERRDVSR
jgi:hypothetical protein